MRQPIVHMYDVDGDDDIVVYRNGQILLTNFAICYRVKSKIQFVQ